LLHSELFLIKILERKNARKSYPALQVDA